MTNDTPTQRLRELERENAELQKDRQRIESLLEMYKYNRRELDEEIEDYYLQKERERCWQQEV